MNSKDYFSFIREFPHTLAVYLTYTLDQQVVDKIMQSSTARTIIIHDKTKGITLKENYESRLICIPAILHESNNSNCFHPKLAILKGNETVKVLIGSMNLSRHSFQLRQEICMHQEYEIQSVELREIIKFLETIKLPDKIDLSFINELKSTSDVQIKENKNSKFIYNCSKSISKYFTEFIPYNRSPVLKIASPFLSKQLTNEYTSFIETIKPNKIELYTRTGNNLPVQIKNSTVLNEVFSPIPGKSKDNFHGKLICADYDKMMVLYLGSANFTEQGFFRSFNEGGNQECGMLLRIMDEQEKASIRKWFNEGWNQPVPAIAWEPGEKEPLDEDLWRDKAFLFAVKNRKIIDLYIFIPDQVLQQVKLKVNDHNIIAIRNAEGFYHAALSSSLFLTDTLKVKGIDEDVIEVSVFQPDKFEKWRTYDGDSLFTYKSSKIESTNYEELKDAISIEGISIGGKLNKIVEPPALEQFYYNTRNEISSIRRRKVFTVSHLCELQDKLAKLKGGPGQYYIMQLIKTFNFLEKNPEINLKVYLDVCYKYLDQVVNINGETKSIHDLIKNWIQYE